MSTNGFEWIPNVLEEDEIPFVLAFAADPRPCLDLGGIQIRRAADRFSIDIDHDPVWLRVLLINVGDNNYVMANLGPLLNEWWDLLGQEDGNQLRPFLSAGVARRPVKMRGKDITVGVSVVPPSEDLHVTTTIYGVGPGLTDETLLVGVGVAPAIIGAALSTLAEYRSLMGDVPQIDIQIGQTSVSLEVLLDSAAEAAKTIPWHRVP